MVVLTNRFVFSLKKIWCFKTFLIFILLYLGFFLLEGSILLINKFGKALGGFMDQGIQLYTILKCDYFFFAFLYQLHKMNRYFVEDATAYISAIFYIISVLVM